MFRILEIVHRFSGPLSTHELEKAARAGGMPPRKLAPLKAKARGRSKSSSPVALDDERPDAGGEGAGPASGQDVGLTTTPAKRKGKKNRERAPLLEGAGLAPDPDSAYVPPKLRRRDNMNGMSGNASPLARLARTGSGPVASRCGRFLLTAARPPARPPAAQRSASTAA